MITKLTLNTFKKSLIFLAKSVRPTLGPTAKNAIIDNPKNINLVDDGITILKSLEFKEKDENTVLKLIREASLRTNQIVGDGTTTTALISCKLLEESLKFNQYGIQNHHLIIGIKKILYFVIQKTKEFSVPLKNPEEIKQILSTSIGNFSPKIIEDLKNAFVKKGKDGILTIEEKMKESVNLEIRDGIQLEQGYLSSYFIKDFSKTLIEIDNPCLLITDKFINNIEEIREILHHIKKNKEGLILIASGFEKSVLSTLIINNINENIQVVAIKAPYFSIKRKMVLDDICFITSTNFIDEKIYASQYQFKISDLGKVKKAKISKNLTNLTLLNSSKLALKKRINELQRELKINDSIYEKEIINYRISLISGAIAKFYISASTNSELSRLKYKVEDGINSVKTAFQEGINISSNSFYLHLVEPTLNWSLLNLTTDEFFAFKIFEKGLKLPFSQICENVNLKCPIIAEEIFKNGYPFGYDFEKKYVCNLKKIGILDSSKMIRVILQNSVSIVTSLISTFEK